MSTERETFPCLASGDSWEREFDDNDIPTPPTKENLPSSEQVVTAPSDSLSASVTTMKTTENEFDEDEWESWSWLLRRNHSIVNKSCHSMIQRCFGDDLATVLRDWVRLCSIDRKKCKWPWKDWIDLFAYSFFIQASRSTEVRHGQ